MIWLTLFVCYAAWSPCIHQREGNNPQPNQSEERSVPPGIRTARVRNWNDNAEWGPEGFQEIVGTQAFIGYSSLTQLDLKQLKFLSDISALDLEQPKSWNQNFHREWDWDSQFHRLPAGKITAKCYSTNNQTIDCYFSSQNLGIKISTENEIGILNFIDYQLEK